MDCMLSNVAYVTVSILATQVT